MRIMSNGRRFEIGDGAVARAEPVERQSCTEIPKPHEELRGIFRVLHHHALGECQAQGARCDAGRGRERSSRPQSGRGACRARRRRAC